MVFWSWEVVEVGKQAYMSLGVGVVLSTCGPVVVVTKSGAGESWCHMTAPGTCCFKLGKMENVEGKGGAWLLAG